MASDPRINTGDLSPVATQQQGYVVPERRSNADLEYRADTLQRIFAKGQTIASQAMSDQINAEHKRLGKLAEFKADTEFTKMRLEIEPKLKTTPVDQVQNVVNEAYNKYFGAVHGEDGDPWLQAALADSYHTFVPKAMEIANIAEQERESTAFKETFSENTAVYMRGAITDGTPREEIFKNLDGRFALAKDNPFGVTPQDLNKLLLMHGSDAEFRDVIYDYAIAKKLDLVNNAEYEPLINAMKAERLNSDFADVNLQDRILVDDLVRRGDHKTLTKMAPELVKKGKKYGKDVSTWIAGEIDAAKKQAAELDKKLAERDRIAQAADVFMNTGVMPKIYKDDGTEIPASKAFKVVEKIMLKNPQAYGKQLGQHQTDHFKGKGIAFQSDIMYLQDQRNWSSSKDGVPQTITVTDPKTGKPRELTVSEYSQGKVTDFFAEMDALRQFGGEQAVMTQLGTKNYAMYNAVKSAIESGRSLYDISKYLAQPELSPEHKVTKKEVTSLLSEVASDKAWYKPWFLEGDAQATNGAYQVVKDMLEFQFRLNGGNRSPEAIAAVKAMIADRFRLIDMGGMGDAKSLIDFRSPELIDAFSTEVDGKSIPMAPDEMAEAFEFVMGYRNKAHYTPMYNRGELVDDPDDFYLVDDQEDGWYQVMSHNKAYDRISAAQIAQIWFKHKAGELNQELMNQNSTYDDMDTYDNPEVPIQKIIENTKDDKEFSPVSRLLRFDRKPTEMLKPRSMYTEDELTQYKRDNGLGKSALTFPTELEYQKQVQTFNQWVLKDPTARRLIGDAAALGKGANDSTSLLSAFINYLTAGNAGNELGDTQLGMPEGTYWLQRMLPEFTEEDAKFGKKK